MKTLRYKFYYLIKYLHYRGFEKNYNSEYINLQNNVNDNTDTYNIVIIIYLSQIEGYLQALYDYDLITFSTYNRFKALLAKLDSYSFDIISFKGI